MVGRDGVRDFAGLPDCDRRRPAGHLEIPSLQSALVAFAFATAIGLLPFQYRYLEDAAFGDYDELAQRLIDEMTGAYAGVFLLAIPIVLARRFLIGQARWIVLASVHAAGILGMSIVHTSLNYALRSALYPAAGLGSYDYGYMPVRYLMELPHDVISYAIVVGFVHLFDLYRRSRDREVDTARLEARLSQAQLQALRLQIQPHFLFNALNTISSLVYEDSRAADEMLAKLSEFLRLTLDGTARQIVSMEEEIAFLDLYLDIMRARFGDRLEVRIELSEAARGAAVPQLLLQPVVENAVRHGADPDSGAIRIDVRAYRKGDRLVVTVRDWGPGIRDVDAALTGGGIGLANTADRLERLFGNDHSLEFSSPASGGLEVSVALPFEEAQTPVSVA